MVKNNISDEGFQRLLSFLLKDENVQVLNMTGNKLGRKSLDMLLKFAESNSYLKTIYVTHNRISPAQLSSKKQLLDKHELEVMI